MLHKELELHRRTEVLRYGCLMLAGFCASSCLDRARLNTSCHWAPEPAVLLNVHAFADHRHLSEDAQLAEEIAIRSGDALLAAHGLVAARSERTRCRQHLYSTIADLHGVSEQDVVRAAERRDWRVDLGIVLLPFAMAFAIVANYLTGVLYDRFPIDIPLPAIIATVLVSLVVAFVATQFLGMWASVIEMVRFRNSHLSFRVGRLPWNRHLPELLAGGVVVFWAIAWRRACRQ